MNAKQRRTAARKIKRGDKYDCPNICPECYRFNFWYAQVCGACAYSLPKPSNADILRSVTR
jgi:hypothetical protein